KVLGLTVTGQYQMAGRLATAPGSTIGGPFHGVMFPAFSGLASLEHHRDALRRTLAVVLSVALPLALGVTIFSPLIVGVLLGPGSASARGSRPAGSPPRSRSARCRPSSGSRAPGGSSRRTRRCGRSKVSSEAGDGIRRRGDRLALRLGWPVADTALRRAAARDARSGRVRREAGDLEPGRSRLRAREVATAGSH